MLNYDEALRLLRDVGCSYNVIKHCILVSKVSVDLAGKVKEKGHKVDIELCQIGGLTHDIGRSKTHNIFHGSEGAKILKRHPKLARIAERHIGGGIDNEEARVLKLPVGDYMPESIEEKIVCYADKLVQGEKIMKDASIEYKKLEKSLGGNHPAIRRLKKIEDEIKKLIA